MDRQVFDCIGQFTSPFCFLELASCDFFPVLSNHFHLNINLFWFLFQ